MEGEDTEARGRSDVDGSARASTGRCAGPLAAGADTRHAARAAEVQQDQAAGSAATQTTSGGAAARDSQHGPGDRPHSGERHSGAVDGTGTRQREAWEMYGVQPTEVVDVLIEWAMHGDGQQKDSGQAARAAGMPEQRMERMGDDGTLVSDRVGDGTTNGDERSGTEQQQSAAGTSSNESATTPTTRRRQTYGNDMKRKREGNRCASGTGSEYRWIGTNAQWRTWWPWQMMQRAGWDMRKGNSTTYGCTRCRTERTCRTCRYATTVTVTL